jgi:hypothetical protein
VVRSFCFGLILSPPLAWIAKNGYLEWNIGPFPLSPPLANNWNMSEDYTIVENDAEYRQRVDNTEGVEWKRCLCRILHFPFNLRLSIEITWKHVSHRHKEIWSRDMSIKNDHSSIQYRLLPLNMCLDRNTYMGLEMPICT